MKCIVLGNCQSVTFANIAARMLPSASVTHHEATNLNEDFTTRAAGHDIVFAQKHILDRIDRSAIGSARLVAFPRSAFGGFHPDMTQARSGGRPFLSPVALHSAIILASWHFGVEEAAVEALFNDETYDRLGYFDAFAVAKRNTLREWEECGLDAGPSLDAWMRLPDPFMLTINHPTMPVMMSVVRETLAACGLDAVDDIEPPDHHLLEWPIMPVYPGIAARLGKTGSMVFRGGKGQGYKEYDLPAFITGSYERYGRVTRDNLTCVRVQSSAIREFFDDFLNRRKISSGGGSGRQARPAHPYLGIPNHQNWRKGHAAADFTEVDPVVRCGFRIRPAEKVATAGSCFAQHLANALSASGLTYYVAEPGDRALGYGVYSARYGNVYTTAQLNQLIDRAHGDFAPIDTAWRKADGSHVDPFRPEMPQVPGATEADVARDRETHFGHVREMIRSMDYFVFTLGLTEGWRSRIDGAVFPIAPGVAAGAMDDERYEFVNFDERETYDNLAAAIAKIRAINPRVRVILTVSPVPLMATFEPRHVLVSTTYSKAVLRVVAERATREIADVHYFPSYEIITGNYNRGAYYEDDLRSVRQAGVNHVMRLFLRHATSVDEDDSEAMREARALNEVFCAEELLAAED